MREHFKWTSHLLWDSNWNKCRTRVEYEYSFNLGGGVSKLITKLITKFSLFLHFSNPASQMIPDIVSNLNDWRLSQINWDYICQKSPQEKCSISDIWWASYVGRIKFSGWHQHERLVGWWVYNYCSQNCCFIRYKCNSAYCAGPLNQIGP